MHRRPSVTFEGNKIKFSAECTRKFGDNSYIELLVNPITRKFAIRPTDKSNRNAVIISKLENNKRVPKVIPCAAFFDTLYSIFGWNTEYKYRITGTLIEQGDEVAYLFDAESSEAFFKTFMIPMQDENVDGVPQVRPLTPSGKHIRAIPKEWTTSFGKQFYIHEQPLSDLQSQSEDDWKLRLRGRLFETGKKINVTPFEELRSYIAQELSDIHLLEVNDDRNE